MRKSFDNMELEKEIQLRVQEQSIDLGAVVMTANDYLSLQERLVKQASPSWTWTESTSIPPHGGVLLNTVLAKASGSPKAEEQAPVFSGEPTEHPIWEEAIALIQFWPFRQPITKFNATKKSLSLVKSFVDALKRERGEAEIVTGVQKARLDKLEPPNEDDCPYLRNFIAVRTCLAMIKAHWFNVDDN
uniref:Uncharacterized protein n=1 Tax=Trichuris muris TaxID=70415 RepID=A0A5S6QNK6_TRIMR